MLPIISVMLTKSEIATILLSFARKMRGIILGILVTTLLSIRRLGFLGRGFLVLAEHSSTSYMYIICS